MFIKTVKIKKTLPSLCNFAHPCVCHRQQESPHQRAIISNFSSTTTCTCAHGITVEPVFPSHVQHGMYSPESHYMFKSSIWHGCSTRRLQKLRQSRDADSAQSYEVAHNNRMCIRAKCVFVCKRHVYTLCFEEKKSIVWCEVNTAMLAAVKYLLSLNFIIVANKQNRISN